MNAHALLEVPHVRRVLELLNDDGEQTRIVGGAIRNVLLGRTVKDFDLATTILPTDVVARARTAGLRTIPTGIAHGTVTVLVDGRPFEVTTLREDIATDGRHATVRFGRDFEADARRRDFTINALSMGPDGEIHDYADGRADLAAGRVRFIGDPVLRIREDYLRILRFFRFSADYATGAIDPDGLAATIQERDGLGRLSRERIGQEMLRLLVARRAVPAIVAMADVGLLGVLLQSVPQPARLDRLLTIDAGCDAILRLTALCAIVPEDAGRLRDRLRLSNVEATRIEEATRALTLLHGHDGAPEPGLLRGLLFEVGRERALDGLLLAWAESRAGADDGGWQSARRFLADTPEPRLPFSAAELKARGVAAGRPMGKVLKRLQANWIRAGFPQDPRSLAALLREVLEG